MNFNIQELPIGTPIGYVSATDIDIGVNAEFTYSVLGGGFGAQYFYMDSIYPAGTGVIKVKQVRSRCRCHCPPQGGLHTLS